jgi:hypothetical protein
VRCLLEVEPENDLRKSALAKTKFKRLARELRSGAPGDVG